MKYSIGDVIKIVDGIDYNGDSSTYFPGEKYEISDYDGNGKYLLIGFYRLVEESEIECLVIGVEEKCRKYKKELSMYNQSVFILSYEDDFKFVLIHHFSFERECFVYEWKDEMNWIHYLDISKYWKDELTAYRECYRELRERLNNIKNYVRNI